MVDGMLLVVYAVRERGAGGDNAYTKNSHANR